MDNEKNMSIADQLREERFTTKQDLLDWIDSEMLRVADQSKTDKKHSAAFYYAYTKLLKRFRKKIDEKCRAPLFCNFPYRRNAHLENRDAGNAAGNKLHFAAFCFAAV